MTLTVGSLFAGIGGFDLGFERAGMRTVWFCEQDPYCQRVLARHWPGVPCYPDVRALVSVPPVDVLCGGFPCQDLSAAGRGAGIHGARSGLWFEFLRLIGELRPRYVVVENVPQLRKYLGVVTGGLAEIGYDAEWDVISAADFGAPHLRKRLWLVAYPQRDELREQSRRCCGESGPSAPFAAVDGEAQPLADPDHGGRDGRAGHQSETDGRPEPANGSGWLPEPDVGRVAHGVSHRVERLRALGNALVPQIAEWIGLMIVCDAS